jgi:hypothetical protein
VLIAGIAAVLFIAGVSPIIVIILAALLGITILPAPKKKQDITVTKLPRPEKSFLFLLVMAVVFFVLLYLLQFDLFTLAATMAICSRSEAVMLHSPDVP